MSRIDDSPLGPLRPAAPRPKQADSTAPAAGLDVGGWLADTRLVVEKAIGAATPAPGGDDSLLGRLKGAFGTVKEKISAAIPRLVDAGYALMGTDSTPFTSRDVFDDPSDVNHPTDDEVAQAREAIKAHSAAERAAHEKLGPIQQQQYEAVVAQTQGRPTARRALQQMLIDGRLPGEKDFQGQGDALAHLAKLAAQPLAKGIDRAQLVSEVLGEVENPVRIAQKSVGTCGATTAQIALVRKRPAEYVRLLSGLASPEGQAQMAGGKGLKRLEDWNSDNDGGRTVSSRLFQPAVMDFGEPMPGDSYDNSEDKGKWGPIKWGGLWSLGSIYTQLLDSPYKTTFMAPFNRDARFDDVVKACAEGRGPVAVSLRWNPGGGPGDHFVQVDKVENGKVTITNPWGQRERYDVEDFKRHLTSVCLPQ